MMSNVRVYWSHNTSVANDGRVNAHFGPEIKVLSTKMAHCSDKLFIIINLELKVSV